MTLRVKSLLARARRLQPRDGVYLITIIGDPEAVRLGAPMASNREALIGEDHYAAAPEESVSDFHERLRGVAKGRGATVVCLGHPENAKALKAPA